jgi:hypothetical protein
VGMLCENHIILDEDADDVLVWTKNPRTERSQRNRVTKPGLNYALWVKKNGGGENCGKFMPLQDVN